MHAREVSSPGRRGTAPTDGVQEPAVPARTAPCEDGLVSDQWDDVDDPEERLEDLIESLDRPLGVDDRTTATEQREGDTLDESLRRETRTRDRDDLGDPKRFEALVDLDEPDDEPELIGEEAEQVDGSLLAEEAAVRVIDEAPGAADDPNDGYDE